ncbi:putative amidohydrolase 1 [Phaeomoniella chlamydospora]|uniref:dihydropyrimidinase n=1 Tax=Phaeomoniella chlamydospora TaxID=158046 RepID=A0A0G2FVJ8_PHACM|nr:putative amidohydrolase 1 [Phaeomoniella chlamydospora]
MEFDLIIKNATIVTAAEILPAGLSIGVKDGKISCIASSLPVSSSTKIIDADGAYVTPGGVDSHVHLAQDNAPTGDGFLTGTRSALAGGTTTVLAFASQKRTDESLFPIVEEYHRRSCGQSYVDYGFHIILSNPTEKILNELPLLIEKEGITSVKLYMTYVPLKLSDGDLLDVMMKTRELGMTTMIHAENSDMIDMITKRLLANSHATPGYHAIARPQLAETEATYRAISLSTLTSTPILLVHMSSPPAINHVRKSQKHLLPIHAETCPHYLYLLSSSLGPTALDPDKHSHCSHDDLWSGARNVCAPPLRHSPTDLTSLWKSLNNNTINVVSSDHAPSTFNHPDGKLKPLTLSSTSSSPPTFTMIPNGLPGLETRLPLLFSAATTPSLTSPSLNSQASISLPRFVALTSTTPATLYGLSDRKGSITPGLDADIVIWYPANHTNAKTTIQNQNLHHSIDYTPFEGLQVGNWPRYVLLRGQVVWDKDGDLGGAKGLVGDEKMGRYLKRGRGRVVVGNGGVMGESGGDMEENVPVGMREGERELWM